MPRSASATSFSTRARSAGSRLAQYFVMTWRSGENLRNSLPWAESMSKVAPIRTVTRIGLVPTSLTSDTTGPDAPHSDSTTVSPISRESWRMCRGAMSSTRRRPCATAPSCTSSGPGSYAVGSSWERSRNPASAREPK